MLKLSKFFVALFSIYIFWFYGAHGPQNIFLYAFAIGAVTTVVIDIIRNNTNIKIGLRSIVPLLFIYGAFSFMTGIFVAIDLEHLISSLITYFAYSLLCYAVSYIIARTNKIDWIYKIIFFCAWLCVLQIIFDGVEVRSSNTTVITMGENNNPNSLGMVMLIGMYSAIGLKWHAKHFISILASLIMFEYVIILSGSRKCFLASIVILAVWLITVMKENLTFKIDSKKKAIVPIRSVINLAVIGCIIILAYVYFNNTFTTLSIFERLSNENMNSGADDRWLLYSQAFEAFKEKPIFGIGFRQYELYYKVYSHSTYAEALACTGIIGVIIIMWAVLKLFIGLWKNYLKEETEKYYYFMAILMFIIELFIGLGQIWFYDFEHLLLLTILFQFSFNKYREKIL